MRKLVIITGASGAGKTSVAKELDLKHIPNLVICYFDSIGVPTPDEMVSDYGNGEEWQRIKTDEWIERIKTTYLGDEVVLLDGQIRPSFVIQACTKSSVSNYEVVLFDCFDEVRTKRLVNRGHPELVNPEMMNWANYLRTESQKNGLQIIDTSNKDLAQSAKELLKILNAANSE